MKNDKEEIMLITGFKRILLSASVLLIGILLTVILYLVLGCSEDNVTGGGKDTVLSECKSFDKSGMVADIPPTQDCFEYEYDGQGILSVRHINAGFNCCPEIMVNYVIDPENEILTITEVETKADCHCNCLFDYCYKINDLTPGLYTIIVEEPYRHDDDPLLEFAADLNAACTGSFIVDRSHYPWGMAYNPGGSLTGYSDCGGYPTENKAYDVGNDQDCVKYEYDGESVLLLRHINAGLNCCPVMVSDIQIDGNNIVIREIDSLDNGGCECNCLFDIDYEITGLWPGQYTIKIIEPYIQPEDDTLTFVADLFSTPAGTFCVSRSEYPWGTP
ncbi:MAG: hypothetical protein JSV44_03190 [Candidatus Zixiibacteriota bacterium]|nr:MAG: hypothetical protein JSV44_03190 [candidate division Zixibacteria bacterium]